MTAAARSKQRQHVDCFSSFGEPFSKEQVLTVRDHLLDKDAWLVLGQGKCSQAVLYGLVFAPTRVLFTLSVKNLPTTLPRAATHLCFEIVCNLSQAMNLFEGKILVS